MMGWSRPPVVGAPFCAVRERGDSVVTYCRGRWQPSEQDETCEQPPAAEKCGGCARMLEPLPCPFCGAAPEVWSRASDHTPTGEFHVIVCGCGGYGAKAWQHGDTAAQALERWNARHLVDAFDHLEEP